MPIVGAGGSPLIGLGPGPGDGVVSGVVGFQIRDFLIAPTGQEAAAECDLCGQLPSDLPAITLGATLAARPIEALPARALAAALDVRPLTGTQKALVCSGCGCQSCVCDPAKVDLPRPYVAPPAGTLLVSTTNANGSWTVFTTPTVGLGDDILAQDGYGNLSQSKAATTPTESAVISEDGGSPAHPDAPWDFTLAPSGIYTLNFNLGVTAFQYLNTFAARSNLTIIRILLLNDLVDDTTHAHFNTVNPVSPTIGPGVNALPFDMASPSSEGVNFDPSAVELVIFSIFWDFLAEVPPNTEVYTDGIVWRGITYTP